MLGLLGAAGPLGNSRLYVISPDGANATNPETSAAHPHEQAYLAGWPAAPGMLQLEALPTIGDGVSTQAVVGDVHPNPGLEIVASAAVGPLYVLDAHGDSVYGTADGLDVPLLWSAGLFGQDAGRYGAAANSTDLASSAVAFGGAALGRLDADARADITAPTAGFTRLIDILGTDLQLPNDDHVMAWNGADGNALAGFPRTSPDLAFFVTPAVADIDGDGDNETIAGNGVYLLGAWDASGVAPPSWPKLTGGWLVGTPGLGDWDGDGTAELAVIRRDGQLLVWRTGALAAGLSEWPRFGGSGTNAGALSR